jgi:hypothetical protein
MLPTALNATRRAAARGAAPQRQTGRNAGTAPGYEGAATSQPAAASVGVSGGVGTGL